MDDRLAFELLILGLIFSGAAYGAVTGTPPNDLNETEVEMEIHKQVNEERLQRGFDDLKYNESVAEVAEYHSDDMADKNYFSHKSPQGEGLVTRYDKFGLLNSCNGGENIFHKSPVDGNGPEDVAEAIVTGWMNSKRHRENILSNKYDQEGIGVVISSTDPGGHSQIHATQNFC